MSIKTEREKKWRKAARKTLAFELNVDKDSEIIEFWATVQGKKVDVFRELTRLAVTLTEWAATEGGIENEFADFRRIYRKMEER